MGRNGAGKTTLLRIALGREEPDAGAFIKANAARIATVDQALPSDLGREAARLRRGRVRRPARGRIRDAPAGARDGGGGHLHGRSRPLRRAFAPFRERGRLRHGGGGREGAFRPRLRQGRLRAPARRALGRPEEPGDARPRDPGFARRPAARRADQPPRLPGRRVPRGIPGPLPPRLPRRDSRPPFPRPGCGGDRGPRERPALLLLGRLYLVPSPESRAHPVGHARLREAAGLHRQGEGVHPPQHRRRQLPAGQGPADQARPRRPPREADRRHHVGVVPVRRRPHRRADLPAGEGPRRGLRGGPADRARRLLRAAARGADGDPGRERDRQDDAAEDSGGPACAARGRHDDRPRRLHRLLRPGAARSRPETPGDRRRLGPASRRDGGGDARATWRGSRFAATTSSRPSPASPAARRGG